MTFKDLIEASKARLEENNKNKIFALLDDFFTTPELFALNFINSSIVRSEFSLKNEYEPYYNSYLSTCWVSSEPDIVVSKGQGNTHGTFSIAVGFVG